MTNSDPHARILRGLHHGLKYALWFWAGVGLGILVGGWWRW